MRATETEPPLRDTPGLELVQELAPEDCRRLQGNFVSGEDLPDPLLIVAVALPADRSEIAATRILRAPISGYAVLLPEGSYELLVFADIDGDGFFRRDEVVGRTGAGRAVVSSARSSDGFSVEGPPIVLDFAHPASCDLSIDIKISLGSRSRIFKSLDDEFFSPHYGALGLYNPSEFLDHTQGFFFGLEEYDPQKTIVIFVHGSSGTPKGWKAFLKKLDRGRFQPWFFYYPSGMSLKKLGVLLAGAVRTMDREPGRSLNSLVFVAHSMGGLISWAAINDLCREGGCPSYLKEIISFSAPYGGIESLRQGVERLPVVVPSWRDMAPQSDFLTSLYRSNLPGNVRFCLFFGYRNESKFKMSENSDGAVALKSQLDLRAQKAASRICGFDATHIGILVSETAIAAVIKELDEVAIIQNVHQIKGSRVEK